MKNNNNFFCFISVFLFFCLLQGCSKNQTVKIIEKGIYGKEKRHEISKRKIIIFPGDTILNISKKYKLTVKELVKFNNIKPPYILKPGQQIKIPLSKNYKIKKSDTLFKISKCLGVDVNDIRDKNPNLNERRLIVNSNLKLPYYIDSRNCNNKTKKNKITKNYNKKIKHSEIFSWPTTGKVITSFGIKEGGRRNDGINILSARGNPVRAALDGKVIYRGNELPAWGNLILIKHKGGWTTAYAHLDKFLIKLGDKVKTGDIIGSVGDTGNVEKNQLHFQVRKNSNPVNPKFFLKKN